MKKGTRIWGSLLCLLLFSVNPVLHALPDETEYLGTIIQSGLADDKKWGPFPIGFDFIFYGTSYNEFYINSNGLVMFGSGTNAFNNVSIPNTINPNNYIAPFWDDLIVHSTGDIMYSTIGAAPNRELVIQFSNMSFWTSTVLLGTIQVILFEGSNEIQIQYKSIIDVSSDRASGSEATIGLENADGTGGVLCSYNTAGYIYSGRAIRFTPDTDTYIYDDQALYEGVVLTDAVPKAGVPVLVSPSHNSIAGETVNFRWEAASNASSYFVLISQSSDMSSPVHTSADLVDLSYEFTLMPNQDYYWSANARNSEGTITWSEIWHFQTSSSPPLLAVPQTIHLEQGDLYPISLLYTGGDEGSKTATISSLPAEGTLYQNSGGSPGNPITSVPADVTDAVFQVFYDADGATGTGAGSFDFHFSDGTGNSPDTIINIHVSPPGVPVFRYAAKAPDRIEFTFDRNMADPSGKHLEFSVEDDGVGVTPASCTLKTGDPSTIVLYLTPGLDTTHTITVAYTRGTVTSESGGYLATFDFQLAGKLVQDLSFDPLPDRTFGDADFQLSATASSALPVNFRSSDPMVVSVSGTTVTINNAGEAYIYATQAGDATYAPVTAGQLQVVNKAAATIDLSDQTHDYTGSGIAADLSTLPANLSTLTTYDGSEVLPVNLGSYTVTTEITDDNYDGIATGIMTITDLSAPVPDVVALPVLSGECSVTPVSPMATDAYSGTVTGTTGTPFPITAQGTTVITWTYTDGFGNASTQNQNVTIDDVTDPATPVLSDQTVGCGEPVTAPTTTDACAGTIEGTTSDPLSYPGEGAYMINWTFDDGNGNSVTASQNVIVLDVRPPLTPVLADLTGDCSVTAVAPSTSDACAGIITGTTTDPLTYDIQGTYVINWTFDDGNGNSVVVPQNVTVADLSPPVAPVLADLTGECSISALAPTTTDACSGVITGTTTDPLTYNAQGSYVIQWTFDDGQGNSIVALQNIIVNDVTPPVATALPDLTGECSLTAVAPAMTDACAGTVTGTTTDPLTYDTEGIYVITWTFDDGNGNSTDIKQNVILDDVTDPIVPGLPDLTDECSVSAVAPTATDACAGLITGTTTDPLVYSTQGTYVINWVFDDGNGNIVYANQYVAVADQTTPSATAPSNVATCDGRVSSIGLTGLSDNCGTPVVTYVLSGATTGTGSGPDAGSEVFNPGVSAVTYTVSDGNGNSSQFVVTVTYPVVEEIVVTVSGGTLTCENSGSYQWIRCSDQSIIPGETGRTFQPDDAGDYAVILTQGGCSRTSGCYSADNTGIGDVLSPELTIYPNPVHDFLTMESDAEQTQVTVRIVDMTGQIVQMEELEWFTRTELDLRELKAGLYMIQVHSDQMNRVVRIIKK